MSACGICTSDRLEELEALAAEAACGQRSWRSVAAEAGLTHHASLKNHFLKHRVSAPTPVEEALGELDGLIADTMRELALQMKFAPVEVRPFYAVAIKNLQGLTGTQASQQHLIHALKAIHEVTGMKLEQRLMLEFARAAFPSAPAAPVLPPAREILSLPIGE